MSDHFFDVIVLEKLGSQCCDSCIDQIKLVKVGILALISSVLFKDSVTYTHKTHHLLIYSRIGKHTFTWYLDLFRAPPKMLMV